MRYKGLVWALSYWRRSESCHYSAVAGVLLGPICVEWRDPSTEEAPNIFAIPFVLYRNHFVRGIPTVVDLIVCHVARTRFIRLGVG